MRIDNKWSDLKFSFVQKRQYAWQVYLTFFCVVCVFLFCTLKPELATQVCVGVRTYIFNAQIYIINLKEEVYAFQEVLNRNRNYQKEILELREANLALKTELMHLTQLLKDYHGIAQLKSKSEQYAKTVVGKIISVTQNDYNEFAIIDVGRIDGVVKDDFVINESGLVGRVTHLEDKWSLVTLLTDKTSYIPVTFKSHGGMAITRGTNSRDMVVANQKGHFTISVDDKVITSGFGGLYHEGINVGTVSNNGKIKPSIDIDKVKFICVIGHIPY